MNVISLLFVAQVGSMQPAQLQLQCRPTGGVMRNLSLLEIDIDQPAKSFTMRRYFEGREGQPVSTSGVAIVDDASATLTARTGTDGKFTDVLAIDRTSGTYSLTSALEGNSYRPRLSVGSCARSVGKAF